MTMFLINPSFPFRGCDSTCHFDRVGKSQYEYGAVHLYAESSTQLLQSTWGGCRPGTDGPTRLSAEIFRHACARLETPLHTEDTWLHGTLSWQYTHQCRHEPEFTIHNSAWHVRKVSVRTCIPACTTAADCILSVCRRTCGQPPCRPTSALNGKAR